MTSVPRFETIADIPRHFGAHDPERTAIVFEGRRLSFGALDQASARVARGLDDEGVNPGERVAYLAKDSEAVFELIFGIARAGGVVLGLNWRLAAPELAFILEDAGAGVLFVDPDFVDVAERLREELPALRRVIVLGEPYRAWRDGHPPEDPELEITGETLVVQMYTSGTTGNPKGVMLPHRSFLAIVRSLRDAGDPWIGWSGDDVALMGFPSFHIGGFWWAMTALSHGAALVVLDVFVAWKALESIATERVTKACTVPSMLQMMLAEPSCGATDFSSLDCIVYGGSPIPVPLLEKSLEVFGCGFAQIYGLTETGNTAVCLRPEDHVGGHRDLLRAAGRPYPGVRVKVIDREGRSLPAGETGEICLHSPANMTGYWNRPEATAETLIDGWVHTGDAGHVDAAGYVYVSARVKDMIISAGENIYPAEIESALAAHEAVAEVAVIGVPDARWGELVKAIVVLHPDKEVGPRALIDSVRGAIADFKVPRSIDFVDALPKTSSGKVRKTELREPYWRGHDRSV